MNLDCTTAKYSELYVRWLENPGKLLDLAGMRHGDRVLDLCGGTGVVSRAALDRGALHVVLLDLAPRADHLRHLCGMFRQVKGRAEEVDRLLGEYQFDLVVCRQAVGYLDVGQTARAVARVLRPGGRFVLNAFVKPRWALKTYVLAGRRFFEASGYVGDVVIHLQAAKGVGVDVTKFRWHHPEQIRLALENAGFQVGQSTDRRSIYFVATKDT